MLARKICSLQYTPPITPASRGFHAHSPVAARHPGSALRADALRHRHVSAQPAGHRPGPGLDHRDGPTHGHHLPRGLRPGPVVHGSAVGHVRPARHHRWRPAPVLPRGPGLRPGRSDGDPAGGAHRPGLGWGGGRGDRASPGPGPLRAGPLCPGDRPGDDDHVPGAPAGPLHRRGHRGTRELALGLHRPLGHRAGGERALLVADPRDPAARAPPPAGFRSGPGQLLRLAAPSAGHGFSADRGLLLRRHDDLHRQLALCVHCAA